MAADTGDFRAFREIIARETLISGNLLYATYYAKVSHIQQHAQRSSEKRDEFADSGVRTGVVVVAVVGRRRAFT